MNISPRQKLGISLNGKAAVTKCLRNHVKRCFFVIITYCYSLVRRSFNLGNPCHLVKDRTYPLLGASGPATGYMQAYCFFCCP